MLNEEGLLELIIADDIATKNPITITTDCTLQEALDKLTDRGVSQLPVLPSSGKRNVVGTLTESAINAAYNSAIVRDEILKED